MKYLLKVLDFLIGNRLDRPELRELHRQHQINARQNGSE